MINSFLRYAPLFTWFAFANSVYAIPFGGIRALQTGPIGGAPQFVDIEKAEAEAGVNIRRDFGSTVLNEDSDSKITLTNFKTTTSFGGGYALNKDLSLIADLNITLASDYDEEQDRVSPKSHYDGGLYQHGLNVSVAFNNGKVLAGGGFGFKMFGSEEKSIEYGSLDYNLSVGSAFMPVVHAYGGIASGKSFVGTVGARFFSMGTAVATTKVGSNEKEFDLKRRNPGEIYVDGLFKAGSVDVGGGVTYSMSGQASEEIEEFSTRYETVDGKLKRISSGSIRNDDHVEVGVGAKIKVHTMASVLTGLTYIAPSYKKEAYSSMENGNLGSTTINLGTDLNIKKIRGFFHFNYALEDSVKYKAEGDGTGNSRIDRTLKSHIVKDTDVKTTYSHWDIVVGGGLSI